MTREALGSVFVLGAGPVAMALAAALTKNGHPPTGLWARRAEAAERAGAFAGIPHASSAWPGALRDANVIVFAVSDEAIAPLAKRLADDGVLDGSQVVLHCAGSLAAEVAFAKIPARGKGLVHPLRAIVSPGETVKSVSTMTFGVEGDEVGRDIAKSLVSVLGASTLALQAHQMAAYHAAAAIASNYLVVLLDLAEDVLSQAGIEGDAARQAFADLTQGALDNLRHTGIPKALTGPIRRGDSATVATHIKALSVGPKENLDLYRVLGQRCVTLSRECGDAEPSKLREISELLANSEPADPPKS